MPSGPSLILRGVLAITLMVGFYVLALAVAAALIYIPYAEIVYLERIHFKLVLGCLIGAAAVLWSILPRFDRFVPPGPELKLHEHPEFRDMITRVAADTSQEPPANVFVTLEVNAWVTERGGIMGVGSRRVLGIGLPLLQGLTVDEVRAVIAHEFGHYFGGDTKLGPWIYKTRAAIARSLENLSEDSWIRLPFVAYAKLFMRITNGVSRQQEFAADRVAARVAGAGTLSSALKKLGGISAAFDGFWRMEYSPVLQAARRAPLSGGFAAFLASPKIAARMGEISAEELLEPTESPYDSHPSTASRCEALEAMDSTGVQGDSRPATVLLSRLEDLERELLTACVDPEVGRAQPIDWNSVPQRIWIERWREEVTTQAGALAGHNVADLADLAADPSAVARAMKFQPGVLPSEEEKRAGALRLLGTALGVTLHNEGWTVAGAVAEPLTFHRAGEIIEPVELMGLLASDETARAAWPDRAQRLQIALLPLGLSAGHSLSEESR